MRPQDFLKEMRRICKEVEKCGECPLNELDCGDKLQDITSEKFAKIYDTVERWSGEHHVETR